MINPDEIRLPSDDERNRPTPVLIGILRGLRGMYDGSGEDASDAFASLERELGIPDEP